jgi:ABC-type enterochelin transport system permease subunit
VRATTRPMGVRRGILGGAVLTAVGVWSFVQALQVPNSGAYLFGALGVAFLAAWFVGTRQYVYIVPAAVLLGFGLGILIPGWLQVPAGTEATIFLGSLAVALAVVFLMYRAHRGLLIPAALLAIVAIADQIGWHLPEATQPYFVPVVLIAVGIYMLAER